MRNSYPVLYCVFLGSASQALWVTCPKMKCLTSDALQPFISSASVWSDFWVTELASSVPEEALPTSVFHFYLLVLFWILPNGNMLVCIIFFFFFFPSTSWMQTWLYQDKICIYIMCMCIAGDIYPYLCVYLYTHGVLREKCPQLFRKHWRKKKKPHWSVMLLTRSLLNWSQSV